MGPVIASLATPCVRRHVSCSHQRCRSRGMDEFQLPTPVEAVYLFTADARLPVDIGGAAEARPARAAALARFDERARWVVWGDSLPPMHASNHTLGSCLCVDGALHSWREVWVS